MDELTLEDVETPWGETVLTVTGEVDLATADQLRQRLLDELVDDRRRMVVDLSAVDFLDSTGLSVLLTAHQRLRADGRELVVVTGEGFVSRVIALAGLTEVLAARPDLQGLAPADDRPV